MCSLTLRSFSALWGQISFSLYSTWVVQIAFSESCIAQFLICWKIWPFNFPSYSYQKWVQGPIEHHSVFVIWIVVVEMNILVWVVQKGSNRLRQGPHLIYLISISYKYMFLKCLDKVTFSLDFVWLWRVLTGYNKPKHLVFVLLSYHIAWLSEEYAFGIITAYNW